MVYSEREELLRPGKVRKVGQKWVVLVVSIGLVAIVSVVLLMSTSSENVNEDQVLLQASAENGRSGRYSRRSAPTVTTPLGKVRGVNLTSRGGRDYKGFYNIPYAQPPLGELRFKPPLPATAWTGTRDCTVQGTMCVQKSRYNPDVAVEGTEDCLHVNLFTPKLPSWFSNPSMPVIVYFFGGAFMHGTANDFNCDYFMDEDVVLVIVESRVGALGYLNTGDMHARGNMGLKDQVMALRWVQENIESFGGDPTRVVAFGTSSGAMCAHAHLLSPMSKGLFSGVMSFSGTTLSPGTFQIDVTSTARQFAETMNCTDSDNSDLTMECLRNVSAWDIALGQPAQFGPTLELIPEDGDTSDVFFSDTPIDILLSGTANDVPWLTGVNSAEAILNSYSLLLDENMTKALNEDWETVLPAALMLSHPNQTVVEETTREIHDFYFQNKTISRYDDTRFNLTNLLSDRNYYHTARTAGLNHAKENPVYWYYLTKEANVSFADSVKPYFDPPYGVSHADEVQYFFFRPRYPYIPLDSPWADFSIMLVKLWVSFAATGAPVNPDPNGVEWPSVDPNGGGFVWYNLDDVPKLIEPFTDRMLLWDSFDFDMLYNNYNFTTTL